MTANLVLLFRDGEDDTRLTRSALNHWLIQARDATDVNHFADHKAHSIATRLGPEVCAVVIKRYEEGEPAWRLTEDYGVARNAILNLLRRSNVVVRRQPLSDELKVLLAEEYNSGATIESLSKKYGGSKGAVRTALLQQGVSMRPRGGSIKQSEAGSLPGLRS